MKSTIPWLLLAVGALSTAGCGASVAVGAGAVVARSVVQERSTFDALRDNEVALSLNNKLLNHSGELFRDVSVDVVEGRVVLTGSVPKREHKIAATEAAWSTSGVKAVTDELVVDEDSGTVAYLEDAWISNRLRAELLTDGSIRSLNYNVETVDKVVHVTGIARSEAELTEVLDYAARVPGVAKVVSHVLTIDDPRRFDSARAGAPTSG